MKMLICSLRNTYQRQYFLHVMLHVNESKATRKRFRQGEYFIEQRLVGWIIGKGGATLREIEQALEPLTSCFV